MCCYSSFSFDSSLFLCSLWAAVFGKYSTLLLIVLLLVSKSSERERVRHRDGERLSGFDLQKCFGFCKTGGQ